MSFQRKARRWLAVSSAAAAAALTVVAPVLGNTQSQYTGGAGGTPQQPVSGNFSNGFVPTISVGSSTLELDFNSGPSAFTATDDLTGALLLNTIQLNYDASGAGLGTITAGAGNSLDFVANGSANPTILQDGTGAFVISAPILLGASGGSTATTLTFTGVGSGAETINGGITANNSAANAVTFDGANTITLSGANSWGGATTLTSGGLVLDFSQPAAPSTGVINATTPTALILGGATLTLNGSASGPVSQSFSATTLAGGSAFVNFTNAANGETLNLGTLTRAARTGALDVTLPSGAVVSVGSTANNADGIIGGWATIGGSDWATLSGGVLAAYSAYTPFVASGGVAGTNYSLAGAGTVTASETASSLKITDTAAAQSLVLSTGVTLTLGAANLGGLLYAGGTANAYTISGGTAIGAGAGNELILDVKQGATLTISTPILTASNGSLTKSGAGTLQLSGTNTYTGGTVIDGGTLKLNNSTTSSTPNLGAPTGTLVTVNPGGTLDLNGVDIHLQTTAVTINGFGNGLASGTGAVIDSGAQLVNPAGLPSVNLAGNASVGDPTIRFDIQGTINANGFTLYKVGGNYMAMKGSTLNLNNLVVAGGSWEVSTPTGMGFNAPSTLDTVESGATLTFFNANQSYANTIDLNGGAIGTGSGSAALNGTVNLGPGSTSSMSGTMTFGGVIAGSGALKITGGNETFAVPNTYSGGTTMTGGTLNLAAAGALGSGNFTFSGGTFNQNAANVLNGANQAVTVTAGTLTLGSNTYGGGTTVTGGTLRLNNGGASTSATGSGPIVLADTTSLTSAPGTTAAAFGAVSGPASGNATIAPGGLYTANSAAGGTIGTLDLGALNATSNTSLDFDLSTPSGANDLLSILNLNGLSVNGTVPIVLGQLPSAPGTYQLISFNASSAPSFNSSNFTVSPLSAGNGNLTYSISVVNPSGTQYFVDLTATGTGGGITTVFNNPSPLTDGSGNGDWTQSGNWSNGVPGLPGDNATLNNGTSGALTIDLNGSQHVGSLTLANSGTGAYTLASGTGGTLFMDTGTASPASLVNSTNNNTISAPVGLASPTNITTAGGTILAITGAISGGGSLTATASSAGVLQLGAANSYSGGTNINGGTVQLGIAGALPTAGPVVINSGGTLDINNFAVASAMTINGAGVGGNGVIVNTSTGGGNPAISGGITLGSDSTIGVANGFVITGVISGAHALTVFGPGQLSLNANNSFSGGLVVGKGAGVIAPGTSSTPPAITTPDGFIAAIGDLGFGAANAPVTLSNGSQITVTPTGQVTDTHTFNVNGTVAFGNLANQKWFLGNANSISGPSTATIIRYSQSGSTTTNDFQLAGANSGYSGAWILEGGALEAQSPFSLGNASATNTLMLYSTSNGGADEIASNNLPQAITSAGPSNLSSVIGGDNGASFSTATYTGPITLDVNTYVRMGAYFANTSQNMAFTNALSGPGAISFLPPGGSPAGTLNGQQLILSGNNIAYTGAFNIPAGVALVAASPNALGSATSSGPGQGDLSNSVTLASGAALDIQAAIPGTEIIQSVSGTGIGGTGVIRNTGSTNGSYGGNINLSGNATFGVTSTGSLTLGGAISGGNTLSVVGTNNSAPLILTSNGSSFSGFTLLSGTTQATAANALGAGTITIGNTTGALNATLQLAGTSSFSLAGNVIVPAGSTGTITLGGINSAGTTVSYGNAVTAARNIVVDSTVSGAFTAFPSGISGTGSVTKGLGLGTVQINGASYTGTTTVNGGILQFGGTNTIGGVTVNPTGALSGTGGATTSLAGNLVVNGGGLLAPGGVGNTLAGTIFSIGGNLTLNHASDVYFDFASGGAGPANEEIQLTGAASTLTVSGDPQFLFANGPSTPGTYLLLNDVNTAGVPSNTTLAQIVLPAAPAGDTYSLFNDGSGNVDLIVAAGSAASATWNVTTAGASGSFALGTNWTPNTVPNGSGSSALFPAISGGPGTVTVTLDGAQQVGTLTLNPGSGDIYAFTPGSAGTLAVSSNLTNSSGANTIAAPLTFGGPTTVLVDTTSDANSSLTITSAGSLSSTSPITKTGSGPLVVAGRALLTGGGTISGGTLQLTNTAAGTGANSLSGTFNVTGGSLRGSAVASSVAGSLSNALSGASIVLGNGTTLTLNPQDTTSAVGLFNRQLAAGSTGTNTANENYTVNAAATSLVTATTTGNSQTNLFTTTSGNTGYDLTGKILVPVGGTYTFGLNADDGARLFIDGQLAVNDDVGGGKGQTTNGTNNNVVQQQGIGVALSPGYHDFNLEYTNTGGSGFVEVTFAGPGNLNTNATTAVTAQTAMTYTGIFQPVIQTAAYNPLPNAIVLSNNVSLGSGIAATIDVGSTNTAAQRFVGVELNPSSGTALTLGSGSTLTVTGSSTTLNPAANLDAGQFLAATSTSLTGGGTITINNAPDVYLGGLTDNGTAVNLVKAGAGQLVLDNSIGSATALIGGSTITIQQGRLHLYGTGDPLGSAGLVLAGTGTNTPDLVLDTHNSSYTLDNPITVSSNARIEDWNDTLTTTLGGVNGISVAGGNTLTFDAIGGSSNGTAAGATLTLAGLISGSGALAVQSTDYGSTTTLPGNVIFQNLGNSFSGGLAINSGTVTANAGATSSSTVIGTGPITLATPTTGTPTLLSLLSNGPGNNGTITYGSGTAADPLTVTGAGSTTINVNNNGGNIGNTVGLGALTIGSATLNVTGGNGYSLSFPSVSLTGTPTFAPASANLLLGPITGTGSQGVTVAGSGSAVAIFNGAANYTGAFTTLSGTARLGVPNAINPASAVLAYGGTLDLNGQSPTAASFTTLAGPGAIITNNGAAPSTLTISGGTNVFSGNITDGPSAKVAVVLNGGTTQLAGFNSFSGGLTVNSGATLVSNNVSNALGINPFGAAPVNLNGGSLNLTGQLPLISGLLAQFKQDSALPVSANYNSLLNLNTYYAGLTGVVSANTTAGGKTDLNYSNNNYAGPNAMFGTNPPTATTANYGFTGTLNYDARLSGYINIPLAGTYTFSTTSDDGSVVFVGSQNTPVVNNNAFQGATTKTGTFTFPTAGIYPITVAYYQGGGGEGLLLQMAPPGGTTTTILQSQVESVGSTYNAAQSYASAINVTGNSTVNVTNSLGAAVGPVSIGSSTLSLASGDASGGTYGLTTGAVTITGSPTFNVANSSGGGAGILTLPSITGGATNGITKIGPAILQVTGGGSYGGATNVQGGALLASNPTGSATGTGPVNLGDASNANAFQGVLGGSGRVGGMINVFNGSTISAGTNSSLTPGVASAVGTLNTGPQTWYGGGNYTWKLAHATSSWDMINMSTVTMNTGSAPFAINAQPLNGAVNNFNPNNSYTWQIAHAADASFAGLAASNFVLNTNALNTTLGTFPSNYQLITASDPSGSELDVVYSPAPEPTTLATLGLAAAGLLLRRRRRTN